jgi:hypothetical protein
MRKRPHYCAAQLHFFRDCGIQHRIVVADASRPKEAEAVRAACAGIAEYWRYFDLQLCDKLLAAAFRISTPFAMAWAFPTPTVSVIWVPPVRRAAPHRVSLATPSSPRSPVKRDRYSFAGAQPPAAVPWYAKTF